MYSFTVCNAVLMSSAVAGTLGYNESAFLMEMSQIGFSTHILDVSFNVLYDHMQLCLFKYL